LIIPATLSRGFVAAGRAARAAARYARAHAIVTHDMKLIVTGASGLLGGAIVLAARDRNAVIAVAHRHPLRSAGGVVSEAADMSAEGVAMQLLARHRPDAVIHAAAATDVDGCERDPARATLLNETVARWVAIAAREAGARLIHISTEAVFDGTAGPYGEGDRPNPVNVYGASKLAGEGAVVEAHPEATIVRTTIYGWNAQPKRSLAEWFLSRFEQGQPAPGFEDAWMSPILVDDLADLLLLALEQDVSGVLHIAGRECVSKAAFGRELARTFGYDPSLVTPARVVDADLPAPRALRPCLRVDRAEALLGPLPTVAAGIDRFHHLATTDHRTRLRSLLGGMSS
jgi:dTDP-4-dehydrorhamnose reductase